MNISRARNLWLLKQSVRTAIALALSIVTLGVANPSHAIIETDRANITFIWGAASGPVAGYSVQVSRNGGPFVEELTTRYAGFPEATIPGSVGEALVIAIAAFDASGTLGPPSSPSDTVLFLASSPSALGAGVYATPMTTGVGAGLNEPVYLTAPKDDGRLFVVERAGRIQVLNDGTLRPRPFLDIASQVGTAGDGGLLGLAFDPNYATTGAFYVYYTDRGGNSVLSRFSLGANPNWANPASEEILLSVAQPYADRNGGTIAFSPIDGYLYLGLGDGGSAYDPGEVAQDGGQLLGKMLRLDVSGGVGTPYSIPADNPFRADSSVRDEIWALGLHNPRRFSFDSKKGNLWIGDEGQDSIEEIDFESATSQGGLNYGWDIMEGNDCNPNDPAPTPACNHASLTAPILDYEHLSGNCSVVGGSVYRGPTKVLRRHYIFGDFCSGQLWRLNSNTHELQDLSAELSLNTVALEAIGEGGFGGLYTVQSTGEITRIGSPSLQCADGIDNDGDGRIDFENDSGCTSAMDSSERDSDLPCDDGFDNDRNGLIDYPADPGCKSPTDQEELGSVSASNDDNPDDNPDGEGDGESAGGSKGACGFGFELAFILPPMIAWRKRRHARISSEASTQSR
jgi:hypothetical protein